MKKVAIENTIGHIKTLLQNNGFEVVDLDLTQQTFVPDVIIFMPLMNGVRCRVTRT